MEVLFTAFFAALFTVAGLLFLFQKMIGWHGIAKRKAMVDIACSIVAFFIFAGTSTLGIMTAVMAGFIASVATSMLGKFLKSPEGKEIVAYDERQFDHVLQNPGPPVNPIHRQRAIATARTMVADMIRGDSPRH